MDDGVSVAREGGGVVGSEVQKRRNGRRLEKRRFPGVRDGGDDRDGHLEKGQVDREMKEGMNTGRAGRMVLISPSPSFLRVCVFLL